MRLPSALLVAFTAISSLLYSQSTPVQGIAHKEVQVHAFTQATIHVSGNKTLTNATLLVKEGKIVALGAQTPIPANAVVHPMQGKHLYPSFVELNSGYGVATEENAKGNYPVYNKTNPGSFYWNDAIRPQMNASEKFEVDNKTAENYRKAGFGTVLSHHQDGIARGTSVAAVLGNSEANQNIISADNAPFYSFNKGSSKMNYPSSLMGSIALLKQAFYDANWYANAKPKERNISLEKLAQQAKQQGFFIVKDKWDVLRAQKIAEQFNLNLIYVGGNDLYQNPSAFAGKRMRFVVPINLPKANDLSDPLATAMLGMEDLKNYDWAPSNLAKMHALGIEFAISASDLEKPENLLSEIRMAIQAGLNEATALDALTQIPAKYAGIANKVGTLEKGKLANFVVTSKPIFEKDAQIISNYVLGKAFEINAEPTVAFEGKYKLLLENKSYDLELEPHKTGYKAKLTYASTTDTTTLKAQVSTQGFGLSISFKPDADKAFYRLTAYRKDASTLAGLGTNPLGERVAFTAKAQITEVKEDQPEVAETLKPVSEFSFPLKAFGYSTTPKQESILIKNTTVWTNENEGILDNADVLIIGGKINRVGKNINGGNAKIIDGTGFHLTSGIIDEHSHIAISRGVNEGGQSISAEVSIEDVVNPDDINIYRQLAGGVTAAQLLHGSANPIGGQSALIKLKYGSTPEDLKIKNADGFIKFALGENVKQSNWGDRNRTRFPQTRMGVEQLYYDAFIRAKEYEREKQFAKTLADRPRYDMELETLLEILNKKRFVSCHSYIQSEINMLMHVADSMGFNINTFTHILEGYKVADKMKAHGVSGSTFSDWWAYKFEVKDAIPYNAAIMHKQGVNVGINSDDAEMGRRLNQEAAKIVKYGGISEEEAWKMVTLNPAKMLHLDDRMGSVTLGKDADLVLWSANPLSQQARPLYTIIDGAIYYSDAQNSTNFKRDRLDREKIIQKMMEDKFDQKKKPTAAKREKMYHCDTFNEEHHAH